MNITKAQLNEVIRRQETIDALNVLSGSARNDYWSKLPKQDRQWMKTAQRQRGFRDNRRNVPVLAAVMEGMKMTWMASLEGEEKIIAEDASLDGLIEKLLTLEIPDNTNVVILHA